MNAVALGNCYLNCLLKLLAINFLFSNIGGRVLSKNVVVMIVLRYIVFFQDMTLYLQIPHYIRDKVNILTLEAR